MQPVKLFKELSSKFKKPIDGLQQGVLWDAKYADYFNDYFADIRYYQAIGCIDLANRMIGNIAVYTNNYWNDHKRPFSNGIEALEVQQHKNVITSGGATLIAAYLARLTDRYPGWVTIGKSAQPADAGQEFMLDPITRGDTSTQGAVSASGNILTHMCGFSDALLDVDIFEVGVNDKPSDPSTLFCRAVFDTALHHEQEQTLPTVLHLTNFDIGIG